jgi:hypothetical protein
MNEFLKIGEMELLKTVSGIKQKIKVKKSFPKGVT